MTPSSAVPPPLGHLEGARRGHLADELDPVVA
jgi:hypothetical protein